jgi:hypothetical protein
MNLNQWTGPRSSHLNRPNERQCQHDGEVQESNTGQGRITAQSLLRLQEGMKPIQWTGPFLLLAIGQNQQSRCQP